MLWPMPAMGRKTGHDSAGSPSAGAVPFNRRKILCHRFYGRGLVGYLLLCILLFVFLVGTEVFSRQFRLLYPYNGMVRNVMETQIVEEQTWNHWERAPELPSSLFDEQTEIIRCEPRWRKNEYHDKKLPSIDRPEMLPSLWSKY